ncbi:MAG: VWA domain-containing protein [Vicinamibacterales bacterium]
MDMELLQPQYLWAIPIALSVILAWRLTFRRRAYAVFPLAVLLPRAARASRLRQAPLMLAAAAVPLIAIALSEPVLPYAEGELKSRGLDIVLVLDLSSSMEEVMGLGQAGRGPGTHGPTRMVITKNALLEFIALRPNDRIGLVVFSDNAYVVSPLTFDHDYLRQYVAMVDNQILRNEGMTAIGDGIALANALLVRQGTANVSGTRVVVVFTDGEHNYGLDPVEALETAHSAGARVHVIGVDLPAEIRIRPEVQRLVRAVRQRGGRYADAGTVAELRAASRSIDALEKGWLIQTRTIRNQPIDYYFSLSAVVLLAGAMLLRAIPYFIDVT